MMTGCRIGKVRLKNGGAEIHPIRGHLGEVKNPTSFSSLDYANELARDGRLQSVAVAVVFDGGYIQTVANKSKGAGYAPLIAGIDLLHDRVMKRWDEDE